jgi:TolB-like protein
VWQELKRRKVLRVGGAYIVIAWVLMQVAVTLEETLELPSWFDKVTFAALLMGFPVALLLSWAYDIRPDSSDNAAAASPTKTIFIAILIALALGASGYSYYIFRGTAPGLASHTALPTIAVLPFADLSPEGNQAWFADGIAEEILNVLARTDGLKVASRTASFRFRGDDVDLKSVATELNVATILEGSVRSQDDQLRITAQLINAEDGFHLWSETFDRKLNDIFAIQDEISVSIATALFGELGVDALPEHRFDGTRNVEAHSFYLKGLNTINADFGYSRSNMRKAIPDFQRAIELDPEYSDPWVGLARAENILNIYQGMPPAINKSLIRALSLDPENADAVAELAYTNFSLLNWLEAEQLYLRAISIEPDNARIRQLFGEFLRVTGRIRSALDEFHKAWELGLNNQTIGSLIVNTHAYLGEFRQARAFYEAQLETVGLHNVRGSEAYMVSLLAEGMEEEARAFAVRDFPNSQAPLRIRFFLDRLDGDPDAGERLVEATFQRIQGTKAKIVRSGDIENFLLAGEVELARENVSKVWAGDWGAPNRISLYVDDEVDPRYLPYRANMLLLLDEYPGVAEAFLGIGVDLKALAERGNDD